MKTYYWYTVTIQFVIEDEQTGKIKAIVDIHEARQEYEWSKELEAIPSITTDPKQYGESMMVFCDVTAFGKTMKMHLPVMDNRNQAIKNPDAVAVNKAMMRCLAKAVACFGIGLYIFSGDDLPEGEDKSSVDEGMMLDYLSAIEVTSSLDQLKDIYIEAFAACQGNKAWQTKMIAAKDARKKELK